MIQQASVGAGDGGPQPLLYVTGGEIMDRAILTEGIIRLQLTIMETVREE